MDFIDLKRQYIAYQADIHSLIERVLASAHFIMGAEVFELEAVLAEFIGVKHCITASSGTDTLQMALMALDIGPGDEVITTPFTWISTAEAIALVGATPVFVDIDPKTYLIDIELIENAITDQTKAIMPVSLFGQMPDMAKINALANKYGLAVIEDGAQSFGAMQRGVKSLGASLIGSTSFYPAKPFGCYGDGGALFTDDDALAEKLRAIRSHGGNVRDHHLYIGMNGRFDTLQAAVLLAKFPYLQTEIRCREDIAEIYNAAFKDLCQIPVTLEGNTHIYAQYTIQVKNRDYLQALLKEKRIPTMIYYPKSIHEQPAFSYLGYRDEDLPNAVRVSRQVISLPLHPFLREEEVQKVVDGAKQALFEAGCML
ncbi:MAG: wbpE [Chlamydiales bacterium]|jgi:UDP-2-acetamido-2-deoxy-ribo-hexuluronate aminotransferase|nr:wbpE [Chlamydiales bacterium]